MHACSDIAVMFSGCAESCICAGVTCPSQKWRVMSHAPKLHKFSLYNKVSYACAYNDMLLKVHLPSVVGVGGVSPQLSAVKSKDG